MACLSLLLDIDGVLVRDKDLLNHVKDNCVTYVKHKVPSVKNAVETNKTLYLAYGHTARGLKEVYGADVSDFNEKVYDKKLIDHLCEVIYGTEFQQDGKIIHELSQRRDLKVTLFTNAPSIWATYVKRSISDSLFIRCPEDNVLLSPLKPDPAAYKFPEHHVQIYVDDSLKNLGTIRYTPNWIPMHFTEEPKDKTLWCNQVYSIEELLLFINSWEMWMDHSHFHKFDYGE